MEELLRVVVGVRVQIECGVFSDRVAEDLLVGINPTGYDRVQHRSDTEKP